MWYEVNVSKNGNHLFATNKRSIQTEEKLAQVLKEVRDFFREEEGFKITVTRWVEQGSTFDNDDVNRLLSKYK